MATQRINSGYFLALAAILFWSINLVIASYFATSLQPFEISLGRWLVACIVLFPFAIKGIVTHWQVLKQNWLLIIWLSITGVVLQNTLIYYAGRTASAIDMGLLDVTGPIFLVLLSRIFFKTPISLLQVVGLITAVFGVVVIILQGDLTQLSHFKLVSGDFLMLLNTFAFAVYSLLQAKRPQQVPQPVMLEVTAIVGTIILVPFALTSLSLDKLMSLQAVDFGIFIYLGIFNSVLAYLAWNTALSKIGNIKTSIIYYLLPLFSGMEAYLLLNEQLYWSQLIGGLLVIGGIALTSLNGRKKTLTKNNAC